MILVFVLYAVLASTFIFAKKVVSYAHPFFLIGFRMILSGFLLLGYHWFRCITKEQKFFISKEHYFLFFKVSLFHIYIAFICEFWALQYLSALKTTVMYTSTPFIAAILSYIIFKEKLTIKKIMGIIIGLAGLAPVIYLQGAGEKGCSEILHISLPEVSLAIAIISGAYAWFIVKELMGHGYSLLLINGSAMFVGGILSMITALCVTGFTCPVYNWGYFLFWLSLLILSANVIFYNLYGTLLRIYSITFLSFAGFLSPVFGTFYDWLFMGGIISWHYILALVLITAGLYIFYSQELTLRAQKVHE